MSVSLYCYTVAHIHATTFTHWLTFNQVWHECEPVCKSDASRPFGSDRNSWELPPRDSGVLVLWARVSDHKKAPDHQGYLPGTGNTMILKVLRVVVTSKEASCSKHIYIRFHCTPACSETQQKGPACRGARVVSVDCVSVWVCPRPVTWSWALCRRWVSRGESLDSR